MTAVDSLTCVMFVMFVVFVVFVVFVQFAKALLSILALPISPHASIGILERHSFISSTS